MKRRRRTHKVRWTLKIPQTEELESRDGSHRSSLELARKFGSDVETPNRWSAADQTDRQTDASASLRSGDSGSVFVPSNLIPVVLLAQKDWADVLLYSFRAEKGV